MTAALHGLFLPVSLDLILWRQILTNNTNSFFFFFKKGRWCFKEIQLWGCRRRSLFHAQWGNLGYINHKGRFLAQDNWKDVKGIFYHNISVKATSPGFVTEHLLSIFYHKYAYSFPHSQVWPAEQVEQLFHPNSINHNFSCANISEEITEHWWRIWLFSSFHLIRL